jgi:hypothetical protein
MRQGIEALVAMSVAKKYPVIEDCMPWVRCFVVLIFYYMSTTSSAYHTEVE